MTQHRHFRHAAFVVVIAIYFAVRVWRLTDSCLWFDEIFSVHSAEHPWDSILSFVALDLIHPPLFYVLLKLWIGIGGEGLLWLRLFPVVFSVLAIFPFIALCRELKLSQWTQVLALFLLAINGSLIKYAQEVRMYSPLLCLSLLSIWLFARYFFRDKSFIPLVVVNLLLVYTHYFGWFVIASEVAAILIFQRKNIRRIAAMAGIVAVGFLPWVLAVWQAAQAGSSVGQNIGWVSRPGLLSIVQFVLGVVEPIYYQASSAEPISILRVSVPVLLFTGVAVTLYFSNWRDRAECQREAVSLLGLLIAVPVAVAFIVSWLMPYSIWGTRHLTIVFAPFAILAATAVMRLSVNWLRTTTLSMLVMFAGYAFVVQAGRPVQIPTWCGFDAIAKEIVAPQGAPVYAFEDLGAYHLWFALRYFGGVGEARSIGKISGVEGTQEDPAYFLPRGFNGVSKIGLAEMHADQAWIVYRSQRYDVERPPLSEFRARGYHIQDRRIYEAGDGKVIAVLLAPENLSH